MQKMWWIGVLLFVLSGTDTTRFTYYTDKPSQDGDYLYLAQLVTGYDQFRVKNLFKGQDSASFVYVWGSDGKISALKETLGGNDLDGLLLQYECN